MPRHTPEEKKKKGPRKRVTLESLAAEKEAAGGNKLKTLEGLTAKKKAAGKERGGTTIEGLTLKHETPAKRRARIGREKIKASKRKTIKPPKR